MAPRPHRFRFDFRTPRPHRTTLVAWLLALCACSGQPTAPSVAAPKPTVAPATSTVTPVQRTPAEIVAASQLPTPHPKALPDDPMAVELHRLSNGLSVYLSPDRGKARFTAWIAVRAGSRHDPANSTGLAHYLEHMLFKGTDELGTLNMAAEAPHLQRIRELYAKLRQTQDPGQRQAIMAEIDTATQKTAETAIPNEIDRIYKTLGIEGINAFTSNEMTVYLSDVPANRLEQWAMIEAERFRDPSFRLFYPELEAVYEEKNLSIDNPAVRVDEALMAGLFPQHPYGTQPTIGTTEHLKTPAYADMIAYFERYYLPNNIAIVLAGDLDSETLLPVLERHFGSWQPADIEPPAAAPLPPVEGRVYREVVAPGRESVHLAFRTVALGHDDAPALEVMDWLMANGHSGLLETQLEIPQKVLSAASYVDARNEAGYWEVRATAREGQTTDEVEALILKVIGQLADGQFEQADIDAVALDHRVRQLQSLESNSARASKVAEAFLAYRDWSDQLAYDRRLTQVQKADVLRVARTYLGANYVSVHRKRGTPEIPKIEKPKITPVAIDPARRSQFSHRISEVPVQDLEPEWLEENKHFQRQKLKSSTWVAAKNRRNELFTLIYRFDRGHRKAPLLCHALSLLERSGAGDLDAPALARKLYSLGSSVDFACTSEASALRLRGIDEHFEESVALLRRWLAEPNFDEATVKALAHTELSIRRHNVEDPDSVGRALTAYANYGTSSPWLQQPSNRQIARASGSALKRLLRNWPNYRYKGSYFGPRELAEVTDIANLGKAHRAPGSRLRRRYRQTKSPMVFFVDRPVAKAQVNVLFADRPLDAEERGVAEFYGDYLGGNMSSLIFQEIREARGLAYSAHCAYSTGSFPEDQSAVVGSIATQADKTTEALSVFLQLLRGQSINATRFAESKQALAAAYRATRVEPRTVTMQVLAWDRLKQQADPRAQRYAELQALTPERVLKLGHRVISKPFIVSVTGDKRRLDLKALGTFGQLREMQAKDLFSYGSFP